MATQRHDETDTVEPEGDGESTGERPLPPYP
ncbi:MAG: hypothetical protein ACI9HI_002247, partial [Salinirussus sp.]